MPILYRQSEGFVAPKRHRRHRAARSQRPLSCDPQTVGLSVTDVADWQGRGGDDIATPPHCRSCYSVESVLPSRERNGYCVSATRRNPSLRVAPEGLLRDTAITE